MTFLSRSGRHIEGQAGYVRRRKLTANSKALRLAIPSVLQQGCGRGMLIMVHKQATVLRCCVNFAKIHVKTLGGGQLQTP
jgi:hypothetical protein